MVIFLLITAICLLVYFITRKSADKKWHSGKSFEPFKNHYPPFISEGDQRIISYGQLATRFNCLPDEVEAIFLHDISSMMITDDDRFKFLAILMLSYQEEAEEFNIPANNTPSGILLRWTKEYIASNFQ